MMTGAIRCFRCGKELAENNLGRQDSCEACGADTRVCKNCKHFDPTANNQCREEQAGRQVEKEKSNFCEWFQPRAGAGGAAPGHDKQSLKSAAEALFKKKT